MKVGIRPRACTQNKHDEQHIRLPASFLQRQKDGGRGREGCPLTCIDHLLLFLSPEQPAPRRASLPWVSKQHSAEGASGWGSGDGSRQQQMLASVERKCCLAKRRATVWAECDNEGLAAYLLHCPWGEVVTVSMCVCVWRNELDSFHILSLLCRYVLVPISKCIFFLYPPHFFQTISNILINQCLFAKKCVDLPSSVNRLNTPVIKHAN